MKVKGKLSKVIISIAMVLIAFYVVPSIINTSINNVYATSISKKSKTIAKGNTYTLKVTGTKKKVKWTSSNKKIAIVDKTGKVKAIKTGKVTISAKVGNKKYKCNVKVVNPKISKTSKTMVKGTTYALKVTGTTSKVTWTSSNKKIAKVTSKGKVTALKAGTATITASVNGKRLRCIVKVVNKGLNKTSIRLIKNNAYTLKTYGLSKVTWKSSNTKIAKVNSKGKVTAVKKGTAKIYAKAGNKTYTCTISVVYEADPGWQVRDGKTYYYSKDGEKYIGWNTIDGRKYYFNSKGVLSSYTGIDVSSYQKEVDWVNVKKDNIDFAIIRGAYRGYTKGSIVKDPYFDNNIKGATSAGVKVGVYFFSQAINVKEAEEEAKYIVNLVKPYKISLPIIIDTEYSNKKHDGRADALSSEDRTKVVKAFCDKVRDLGYTPMIYASKNWFNTMLDMSKLSKYSCWVAHYTSSNSTDYEGDYDIWQYTSTGSVGGIIGNVDLDVSLRRY